MPYSRLRSVARGLFLFTLMTAIFTMLLIWARQGDTKTQQEKDKEIRSRNAEIYSKLFEQNRKTAHQSAKKELEKIRGEWPSYGKTGLDDYLEKANLSYKDIGTSEEELRKLEMSFERHRAKDALTKLREEVNKPPVNHEWPLNPYGAYMRFILAAENHGSTLEDLGTSELELNELLYKWAKKAAYAGLSDIRQKRFPGLTRFRKSFESLRFALEGGNLKLEDVKSSETEIKKLWMEHCRFTSCEIVKGFRRFKETNYQPESSLIEDVEVLKQNMNEGALTPEDLGTTEKELHDLISWAIKRSETE